MYININPDPRRDRLDSILRAIFEACVFFAIFVGIVWMLGGCVTGESGAIQDAPAPDFCDLNPSYTACALDDGRDGFCAKEQPGVCAPTCAEAPYCVDWTYAWVNDPQMKNPPICYCLTEDPSFYGMQP